MPPKDKYTNPELRDQIKQEIQDSGKGGAPGQWSARKAQFMASEYKKRGGEYNTDKSQQDESQKYLSKWSEEEWQTKEGSGNAKQEDGTQKRYLPKKAWDKMSEEEKEETEEKKIEGSKEGKQHVENTEKAKNSREQANEEEDEEYEAKKNNEKKSKKSNEDEDKDEEVNDEAEAEEDAVEDGDEGEDDEVEDDDDDDGYDEDDYDDEESEEEDEHGEDDAEVEKEEIAASAKAGHKRKAGSQRQANASSKKQKSEGKSGNTPKGKVGSKHMDDSEPAPRGSAERLPKEGQKIIWKAMPGYVEGEVTEVLTSGKKVDGKDIKASKGDPKIVMKSASSGKICVHKPEACFYD